MNIITPQEYTANIVPVVPDIENNMYGVLNNTLKAHSQRLDELEKKMNDIISKSGKNCIHFLEGICLWILVIMLCVRVFK
jgi:hypothetical protein